MTKKHYLHITVCALLVVISAVLFSYYFKTYIAPESFVIGSVEYEDYKLLPIKDYLSDDQVLFSQNVNDVSFASADGTAKYEYNFDAKEFNGIENSYIIYVNDYMININPSDVNAGTISGIYKLNYYDVEKQVLCASDITISFSFYSLASKLQVSLKASDLGYLMNYFRTDNFIITLAENPYSMMNKDGEVDEVIKQLVDANNEVVRLNSEIELKNAQIEELSQSGEDKSSEIAQLQAEIQSLQTQVSDLNYKVTYYEQLLEAYQNPGKMTATFVSGDTVLDVQLVNENTSAIVPSDPEKDYNLFLGWSVDGETVVDVSNYLITEDTTFNAIYTNVPGVYSLTTKEMTMSWQDMLDNSYLKVSDTGTVTTSTNYTQLRALTGSLILDSSVVTVEDCTFRYCLFSEIILSENTTSVGYLSFANSGLTKFNMPDTVTTVIGPIAGGSLFSGCSSLEKVRLSNNLPIISSYMFSNCRSLKEITIPTSIEFIGYMAFNGCSSLENVVIPNGVTTIYQSAFYNCTNLKSIYISSSVETIGSDEASAYAIVYGCSADLVIYCETSTLKSGWASNWNKYDDENQVTVKYGYSYEEYLAEISA